MLPFPSAMMHASDGINPAAPDVEYSMSKLMLSFAGSSATLISIDESAGNKGLATFTGCSKSNGAASAAFNNAAIKFDLITDRMSYPANTLTLGSSPFSLNLWVHFLATPHFDTQAIFGQWGGTGNRQFMVCHVMSTNRLEFWGSDGTTDVKLLDVPCTIAVATLKFLRIEREGRMLRAWGGPEAGTATLLGEANIGVSYSFNAGSTALLIFCGRGLSDGTITEEYRGYISDPCFYVGGTFRHNSSDFPVPTERFLRRESTDPATPVPAIGDVVLLVKGSGADGSTSFTDLSPDARVLTANGNIQNDTGVDIFGTSVLCDGTGDFLNAPNHADLSVANAVDITMEIWAKHVAVKENTIFGKRDSAGAEEFTMAVTGSNIFNVALFDSTTVGSVVDPTARATGELHHYAFTRKVNGALVYLYLFVDGHLVAIGRQTATPASNTNPFQIGRSGFNTGRDFQGSWNHARVTRVALYTRDFTPPTPPLPTS